MMEGIETLVIRRIISNLLPNDNIVCKLVK